MILNTIFRWKISFLLAVFGQVWQIWEGDWQSFKRNSPDLSWNWWYACAKREETQKKGDQEEREIFGEGKEQGKRKGKGKE